MFDISGHKQLDLELVTKIVTDILHDSYFQSKTASPIQSIEKSILQLRDSINTLATETDTDRPLLTFNIATAILWGNTLYIVQYGNTKAFLMRDGKMKVIKSASEGNFSVASGGVKDGDVVVLETEDFARAYPPENLINISELQTDNLDYLQSAIMIKFDVVKAFSKDEVIDFGAAASTNSYKHTEEGAPSSNKELNTSKRLKSLRAAHKEQKTLQPIIGLLVALAILGILGGLYFLRSKTAQDDVRGISQTTDTTEPSPLELPEKSAQPGQFEKVENIEPEILYDLKAINTEIVGKEILLTKESIVVLDTQGTMYNSNIETPKFEQISVTLPEIRNIINYGESIALVDEKGFKSLNLENNAVTTDIPGDFGVTQEYLGSVYTIAGDSLTKYSKGESDYTDSIWGQNDIFKNAKDIAIDGAVYILTQDNLHKFLLGEEEQFSITGLNEKLSNAIALIKTASFQNIYIADIDNNRVLVLDDQGTLVKQYRPTGTKEWNDIKDISVNNDETQLYVLNGSKIHRVSLQ